MQKKTVKFNRRKHKRDPWITFGILRSVNKKNQLYRTLKQTKINLEIYETRKQRFNQYKNTLRKTIKEAKKKYFSNQFGRYEGNSKKTWQTIDNALHKKSRKTIPDAISINAKLSTNKQEIANEFKSILQLSVQTIKFQLLINTSYKSYLSTQTVSTFNFKLIDNTTTMRYLSNLNISHSCGHDNLSTVTLKYIANEIYECINYSNYKPIYYHRYIP